MTIREILAVGDSITAHCSPDLVFGGVPPKSWVEWIAADAGATLEVYAQPGADSAEILDLLPDTMAKVDIAFVFAGVNNTLSWRRFRRVDLEDTLSRIVERTGAIACHTVVLQIPEALGSSARAIAPYGPRLRYRINRNRRIVAAVAAARGATLIELPELTGDQVWIDGVHPTSTGHRAIADQIEMCLDITRPHASWTAAPTRSDMPLWKVKATARFAVMGPAIGFAGWISGLLRRPAP